MTAACLKKRGIQISDDEVCKIEEYMTVFKKFDKDNNGFLNKQEITNLLAASNCQNKPTPEAIFLLADEDGDHNISKEEFLVALAGVSKQTSTAYLFRSFDKDGDGKIDAKEALEALGHKESPENLKAAERLIKKMDTNGDGKVDPEEFAKEFGRVAAGKCA